METFPMPVNGSRPVDELTISRLVLEQERDAYRQAMSETQESLDQLEKEQLRISQLRVQATEVLLRQQGALHTLEKLLALLQPDAV